MCSTKFNVVADQARVRRTTYPRRNRLTDPAQKQQAADRHREDGCGLGDNGNALNLEVDIRSLPDAVKDHSDAVDVVQRRRAN